MAPRQAIEPGSWARREIDQSKSEQTSNSNFFVYCGIGALVVFLALIVWALLT
jgi:hypothetical protein